MLLGQTPIIEPAPNPDLLNVKNGMFDYVRASHRLLMRFPLMLMIAPPWVGM